MDPRDGVIFIMLAGMLVDGLSRVVRQFPHATSKIVAARRTVQ